MTGDMKARALQLEAEALKAIEQLDKIAEALAANDRPIQEIAAEQEAMREKARNLIVATWELVQEAKTRPTIIH